MIERTLLEILKAAQHVTYKPRRWHSILGKFSVPVDGLIGVLVEACTPIILAPPTPPGINSEIPLDQEVESRETPLRSEAPRQLE